MRSKLIALKNIRTKFKESFTAVLPIIIIVLILTATISPVPSGTLLAFLFGASMLIFGMMFFTLGSEISMSKIGETVGSSITKSKNIVLIIFSSLITGIIVTIAEPDLTVFANQLPSIPSWVLIISVSVGVGIFLLVAVLRMLFSISLSRLLLVTYLIVFVLAFFVPSGFVSIAFDSGGVTTGPMTVPFIMAFGVGIASIRSDRHAADDSFGLVALCSIGPILSVLIFGAIYGNVGVTQASTEIGNTELSSDIARLFLYAIPNQMLEMMKALSPILLFYVFFSFAVYRPTKNNFIRVMVGIVYTYFGLVVFMTGVNVGFLPMGTNIGKALAGSSMSWIIIPIAMIIGFFVVKAEPAVYILNKQVEEMTDGGISAETMGLALSVGVSISLGLSMVRIIFDIPILYFLVPGYAIAIGISFFVPKMYTAIAFDSGGVASGPMTAAFLLPFSRGASSALKGNLSVDAFGIVAMVAMTPLITIQVLGLISKFKKKNKVVEIDSGNEALALIPDNTIIEL